MRSLRWGTANARPITISFWVKCSITGTFALSLRNDAGNYSYVTTYTINAANTWEQKSVTIAGPTAGTWLVDYNTGIELCFDHGTGSSFQTANTDTWQAGSYFATTTSAKLSQNASATWNITGVQIEVGSVATEWEVRPHCLELYMCRYYLQPLLGIQGGGNGTTSIETTVVFPQPMRTTPSASISAAAVFWDSTQKTFTQSSASVSIPASTQFAARLGFPNFTGLTSLRPYMMLPSSGVVWLISEL